jgi:release factor glutamine methyltransferase
MTDTVNWRHLLAETTRVLGEAPAARWLCETASSSSGDDFLAALDEPATERMVAHLDSMVARYRAGEPLAYVLGHWSFRRIEVMVDRRVLIPRPETEVVAGRAIELASLIGPERRVVDLGTGSGIIGLSLAAELPIAGTEVWLTDASEDSLDVARANAAGLGRLAANVRIAHGSWFGALPDDLRASFDVIVSNPPYVAEGDSEIEESVVEWEPSSALFAGLDGLRDIREIASAAPLWLRPGGWLILEIGYLQGPGVASLFRDTGFVDVRVGSDLAGRDRYVEGRLA